jgi:hypothetical protein
MKDVRLFSALIIIQLILISCSNGTGTKKTMVLRSPELIDTIGECQQAETRPQEKKDKELKEIDFFGVKMQGKYEDIVNDIYMLPMLSCVERRDTIMLQGNGDKWFSHTVKFCGVPCGMKADFTLNGDNIMSIKDLCFITSQTDDEIIHKFVSELTKYYGEPDISDKNEDSYHWYLPSGLAVRARHLHASEGGWTVFFYY